MLRKIGIATVSVKSFASFDADSFPIKVVQYGSLDWHTSACCIQLFCDGCHHQLKALDLRHYFPSDLIVHAPAVPLSNGELIYVSHLCLANKDFSLLKLLLISLRPLYLFSAFHRSWEQTSFRPMLAS